MTPGSILKLLQDGVSVDHLETLVQAHAEIGYLVSLADTEYENFKAQRMYNDAQRSLEIKNENPKYTVTQIVNQVLLDNFGDIKAENEAKSKLVKLKNLLSSIVEAINAIKFLGRTGGY